VKTPITVAGKMTLVERDDHTGKPCIKVHIVCTSHAEQPRLSYSLPDTPKDRKLAERLVRAIDSQRATPNLSIATDVAGVKYVTHNMAVFGRYMNADLKRLGF